MVSSRGVDRGSKRLAESQVYRSSEMRPPRSAHARRLFAHVTAEPWLPETGAAITCSNSNFRNHQDSAATLDVAALAAAETIRRSRKWCLRNSDGVVPSSRRNARVNNSGRSNPAAVAIRGIAHEVSQSICTARSTRTRRISSAGDLPKTWRNPFSSARRLIGTATSMSLTRIRSWQCSLMNRTAAASRSSETATVSVDWHAMTRVTGTNTDSAGGASPRISRASSSAAV